MSGPETQQPDDQLLTEFLAGEGAVRAAYREVAQQQAPAHLDAAILQAAQAAARPAPRLRRRWQVPMAAAAVMVLSFSVLLQVQRDPAAQKELMAPPAAPAAVEVIQDVAKAEQAAAVREETANAEQKQAPAAAAKLKPTQPAEKRRAALGDAAPPPPPAPAMAMADAPSPVAAASPAPETAVLGAIARESMPQRQLETDTAPTAKASRAPVASMLMSPRDSQKIAVATPIEHWAQSCVAESLDLNELRQWRGLALAAWTRQADEAHVQTTLLFAAETTQEAIRTALGALADNAVLPSAQCVQPMTRELRAVDGAWALVCHCRLDAE